MKNIADAASKSKISPELISQLNAFIDDQDEAAIIALISNHPELVTLDCKALTSHDIATISLITGHRDSSKFLVSLPVYAIKLRMPELLCECIRLNPSILLINSVIQKTNLIYAIAGAGSLFNNQSKI